MRAGALRTPVVIESATGTTNAVGESALAWATFRSTTARVESEGGREFQAAQQQVAALTHVVAVRYHPAKPITAGMRVKLGTRYMDIVAAPVVDERKQEQRLLCVERAA